MFCDGFISKDEALARRGLSEFVEEVQGIKPSMLKKLVSHFGEAALEGKATFEVVDQHLKPMTVEQRASVTEMLFMSKSEQERESIGISKTFVSHTWGMNFLTLVETIEHFVQMNQATLGEDPFVWLDVVCVNQHTTAREGYSKEWFLNAFLGAIERIGSLLMVLDPWENPAPIFRAWCNWELFACMHTDGTVRVALPQAEQRKMVDAMLRDPQQTLRRMFAKLETAKSKCGRENETDPVQAWADNANLEAITSAVEEAGSSLSELDQEFEEELKWAVLELLATHARGEGEDEGRRGRLLQSMGGVYLDGGKYAEGLRASEEAVEVLTAAEGEDGEGRCGALSELGMAYARVQLREKALAVNEELVALHRRRRGHHTTLLARLSAANSLRSMQRFSEALAEQEAVLASSCLELGMDHEVTLKALHVVGMSYCDVGKIGAGAAALGKAVEGRRALLGGDHVETLESKFFLGKALYWQGRAAEASAVMQECLCAFERRLPRDHPYVAFCEEWVAELAEQRRHSNTLLARLSAANSLRSMQRFSEALAEQEAVLASSCLELGMGHEVTLKALHVVGMSYCDVGKIGAGAAALGKAVEGRRALLGGDHVETLESKFFLGKALYWQGRAAEASAVMQECLCAFERRLPRDHPYVAFCEEWVAELAAAQGCSEPAAGCEEQESRAEAHSDATATGSHSEADADSPRGLPVDVQRRPGRTQSPCRTPLSLRRGFELELQIQVDAVREAA